MRKTRPTSFDLPARLELAELKRREHAKCAAEEISKSLGILFAHSPESFAPELRKTVISHVAGICPASLEAWIAGGWKG